MSGSSLRVQRFAFVLPLLNSWALKVVPTSAWGWRQQTDWRAWRRKSVQLLSSVQLRPHGLQHARLPCLPGAGAPPVAKVMRKEARHTQRWDRASGAPPGNSRASTPKTRVCLLSALCSHLHLWLYGGAVPHYLSLKKKKKVNLQLQLIKFLGVIVFQPTNSLGSPLACLNRFFRPHVIAQILPTVRGMRCSKLSKYRFLWAVKRLIRNCIGEGFFTCWANVCC